MFSVQDKVGDYEIVAKLKSGGMATLFLGKLQGAAGFTRHVAIKVVHEHLATDEAFVRMFVDEALLSAKIHHPNVVHVEELSEVDGRYFLVMEYVHGCSVSQLMMQLQVRRRRMRPELAAYIAVKVAEGLHAAHSATDENGAPLGVVHRDVSPQNVLLAFKGHVKLIDFGVAKAAGRSHQTTGAALKGKIGYMAPEQAFGKPVDARTDVYALGVLLWEMLTGRRAFQADNDIALLELVRNPDLPPARKFNKHVPEALDAVIARALSLEPARRFGSAQEMRKALAAAAPTAMSLGDSDLEHLLASVMVEAMQVELQMLPDSLAAVALSHASDDDALQTLTASAASLSVSSSSTSFPEMPEALSKPEASIAASRSREAKSAPGPGAFPLIAAFIAVLLAAGVGVGIALVGSQRADQPRPSTESSATPPEIAEESSLTEDVGDDEEETPGAVD